MECIGFCSRRPCNCRQILSSQQQYRNEKLKCAKSREKGRSCTCIERICTETSEEWQSRIDDNSYENWFIIHNTNKAKLLKDLRKIKEKVLRETTTYQWRYITITLPKELKPPDISKKIKQLVLNKPFKEHIYCLEFTGKEKQYHPHIHMLYRKISKPSHDNKAICRKFKIQNNYIDYVNNIDEKQLKDIMPYIMGVKSKDKMEQVENDIKILKENDLKKYYYTGKLLSEYILQINAVQEDLQKEETSPPEEL